MSARPLLIGAIAIVAFAVGVLLARGWPVASSAAPETATEIDPPRPLPAIALIDQDGKPLNANFFRNGWTLVFFGFTRCPDVCPTTLATLAQTRAALADLPAAVQPRVLLVSVDPEHDRAPLLKDYVQRFDPTFRAASGDPSAIAAVASGFGVSYAKIALDSDGYTVDHGAGIFFIAPDGIAAYSGAPHDAAALARDFRRVLARRGTGR
jgi:protein SCO1/2